MEKIKLRGQEVEFDHGKKIMRIEIYKPYGNTFSLSDKIYKNIQKGFKAIVTHGDKESTITKDTPFLRKEPVKSNFKDSQPWHRYWYRIESKDQLDLFKTEETCPESNR